MKYLRLLTITIGLAIGALALPFVFADNGVKTPSLNAFDVANDHYRSGEFLEAISSYENALEVLPRAGSVYYNLGNAYYRAGQMGDAILAYERGLLFSPRDRDILDNLKFVSGLLEYKVDDKRSWYIQFGETVLQRFSEREIAFILLGSLFLLLLSWNYVLIFKTGLSWGWFRKGLLILTALSLVLFAAKSVQTRVVRGAIVMEPEIEVRYGPSITDQVAFRLGEGLKVYVIDDREDWSRIILTNGESGWVESNEISQVQGDMS